MIREIPKVKLFSAYGYSIEDETEENLLALSSITLCMYPELLRKLSDFISACADELEAEGEEWDHSHFSEFLGNPLTVDVILYNPERVNSDDA